MLSRVPQKFSFLITLCALVVSGRMNAATIHVPANSATVQGAVDMANPGDVVSIDNSAVYVESVAVQEAITIMAAAGQTPTLRYDSADATPASYMFYSNVSGAQMGSNLGGQITLDGACDNRVTTFLQSNITSGEVVFENLRCINSTPSAYFIYPDPDPPGDGATGTAVFTFNNIVADGVGCNLSGPTARFDDPDFLIRPDLLSGSTINLNNCTITGADRMCILHGGGDNTSSFGVININGSILAGRELAITSEPGDPPRALPITWNVTDSYLESSIDAVEGSIFGGYAAWWIRAAGQVVNATRTVLKENGIGRAFDPWFPGDNGTVTMDHCDIISATNIAITLGPPTLAQPRVVSIRNTNIVAEDSVGFFGGDLRQRYVH